MDRMIEDRTSVPCSSGSLRALRGMFSSGGAAVLVCFLLASSPARAQNVPASDPVFDKAVADMKAGRYETACPAIAESHRIRPRPGVLYTLALCEERRGRIATAARLYANFVSLYESLPPDQQRAPRQPERHAVAKAKVAELGPQVPRLTLSLPKDAPVGTVVKRNGEVVPPSAWSQELRVDPGTQTLTTQAPGGPEVERRIEIAKGEKTVVVLDVKAPGRDTGPSGRRIAAYATGGVGLAGLAVGAVLGGLAIGQADIVRAQCGQEPRYPGDETRCTQRGMDAVAAGRPLAHGATAALSIGGSLAALAGVLLILDLTSVKPGRQGGSTERSASWISVGVLSAGPAGVSVGLAGAL
jgi:hypothetical protein